MRNTSVRKTLGLFIVLLILLAACSGSATPPLNQANAANENQQEENSQPALNEPVVTEDNSTSPADNNPAPPTGEQEGGFAADDSYPAPSDQTAISGDTPPEAQPVGYPPPVEQPENYPSLEDDSPNEDPAYPAPGDEQGDDPNPDEDNPPPIKQGLEATDPSTVSLASGELQFVEFFAFW